MKIGFLFSHLGDSELANTFINKSNRLLRERGNIDIIAFVSNQSRPVKRLNFASMNINEAFDFKGAVVATDIYMAEKSVSFPGPSKIYYYQWELAWVTNHNRTFEEYLALYNNRRLSMITRTEEDKYYFEQCWNRPVQYVIPHCDVEQFIKIEMARRDDKK